MSLTVKFSGSNYRTADGTVEAEKLENASEQEMCDKWHNVLAYVVTRAPEGEGGG